MKQESRDEIGSILRDVLMNCMPHVKASLICTTQENSLHELCYIFELEDVSPNKPYEGGIFTGFGAVRKALRDVHPLDVLRAELSDHVSTRKNGTLAIEIDIHPLDPDSDKLIEADWGPTDDPTEFE